MAEIAAAKTLSQWMEDQIPIGLSHDALLFEEGDATLWVAGMLFRIALDASTPDAPLTPSLTLRPQARADDGLERWILKLWQTICSGNSHCLARGGENAQNAFGSGVAQSARCSKV
jgi:hypothetical protein